MNFDFSVKTSKNAASQIASLGRAIQACFGRGKLDGKEGEVHSSLDLTAWNGPWGISYASNLTPDPTTGLVSRKYNETTFVAMFRTGKKPNGVGILPPMPWENYSAMSDEDLKAIWAYLQTIKPVRNQVPANVPAPPPPTRGK